MTQIQCFYAFQPQESAAHVGDGGRIEGADIQTAQLCIVECVGHIGHIAGIKAAQIKNTVINNAVEHTGDPLQALGVEGGQVKILQTRAFVEHVVHVLTLAGVKLG